MRVAIGRPGIPPLVTAWSPTITGDWHCDSSRSTVVRDPVIWKVSHLNTNRRHDIDALRVFAFVLLIGYHVGMVYVADWGFHIKGDDLWEWLQWPMVAVNRWRMPLLFLVSGIALGLSGSRRAPGRLIRRRSFLLLLPLVFGMVAVVPIQAWCEVRANGAFDAGFGVFLLRYWQFRPWPGGGFAGAEYGVTWNHLWYLAYLWVYTLVLAGGLLVARGLPSGVAGPIRDRMATGRWILLPVAWMFVVLYWLEPVFGDTKALFDDWAQHAKYFPVFVFGFALARNSAAWRMLLRQRRRFLALAGLGLAVYMSLRAAGRWMTAEELAALPSFDWRALSVAAHALYLWTALMAILGYGLRWLNRPFRWLPYANRAVYPWYMLHQSLIVPLAFALGAFALPGPLEALLVLLGTVAGCALAYEFLIRRVRWLHPLFGVSARPVDASRVDVYNSPHERRQPQIVEQSA